MDTKENVKAAAGSAKKKKCIHDGHRARLTDLAINAGLENMSQFQVLEYFLTYIFPRGDVNPLAHRLLDKFDSFTHVVEASVQDLKTVDGIADRSAKMIHMFCELFYYFTESKMGKKCVVKHKLELVDIVEDLLRFRTAETALLLALSPAKVITHRRKVTIDRNNEVSISFLEIGNFLASSKTSTLVIAHGHPYGSAMPSSSDLESYEKTSEFCKTCGVHLLDSYIVGEDGVYSQADKKLLRKYYDVADLKSAFVDAANQAN